MRDLAIYKCPVCGNILQKKDSAYICIKNHTYDIAKEGYVNLLLANQKKTKAPGDCKEMISSRHRFLSKGYYKKLSQAINNLIIEHIKSRTAADYTILDAGCGEGYYLDELYRSVELNNNITFCGIDISKEAIKQAAKRNQGIEVAVAGVFELPIMNKSVNCLYSIFAPYKEVEFERVLKDNGIIIIVSPGAHHLYGLKKILYESPYLNEENKLTTENLEVINRVKLSYEMVIENAEDISDLMTMTPYYWNTDILKINEVKSHVSELTTCAEFILTVFQKKLTSPDSGRNQ
ncbi:MAG TPA: hypothetical protein DCS13_02655 [Candidatus Margulisbacteria bacterium]|nr:MAG: hypothetical protein A2X43_08975 [Candidatus Margulisbacteria bacterium GWD2_39_127]HAR62343.1 hypothetical protein [Candidatus Margulisiibacteriota bacterium]